MHDHPGRNSVRAYVDWTENSFQGHLTCELYILSDVSITLYRNVPGDEI